MLVERSVTLALVASCCLFSGPSLDAQVAPIKLMGAVRDAVTDAPLAGARVFMIERAQEVLTASNGFFVLDDVLPGQVRLVVSAFGYVEAKVAREVSAGDVVLVRLAPEPVEVAGVSAEVARRRLAQRRVALASPFRDFEQDVLVTTNAPSLNDFVEERSNLQVRRVGDDLCYHLAGDLPRRFFRLTVYLDDVRVSHEVFWATRPKDLGLVEIFSRVPMVRAYTTHFLADVSRGRLSVMPLSAQQPKELC